MPTSRSAPILLWAVALKLAVALVLLVAAGSHAALPGLTAPREAGTPDAVWYLARGFDSNAYQRMAREGWYDDFTRGLPLGYPLAIRALLPLVGSAQTAALLVSNACALAALVLFLRLARHYAGDDAARAGGATLLFACLPGVLAFGTVAYSEGPWILVILASWWAWLKAVAPGQAGRHLGWLSLAALLAALSVQVRHAGVAFVGGIALLEVGNVLRPGCLTPRAGPGGASRTDLAGSRARALLEAALVFVIALAPTLAYLHFKFEVQHMGDAEFALFGTRFVPLGGLPSLILSGAPPENIAQLHVTLPLAAVLLIRLWSVDRRLAVVAGLQVFLALSVTGIAAQSINRLLWSIAPLALGAVAIRDRVLLAGMCGVLVVVSLWCGIGHVLGTAAL